MDTISIVTKVAEAVETVMTVTMHVMIPVDHAVCVVRVAILVKSTWGALLDAVYLAANLMYNLPHHL